jgi:DNA-binding CsgD family transcriptional regulator
VPSLLRDVFELTEAECAVALALLDVVALARCALNQGVSINSLYTHLRRMREKTSSHSVAELIRKLEDPRIPLRMHT